MFDKELAKEILGQVLHAVELVFSRFETVTAVSDLTDTPEGMEKLDSLCMQLIVIGEGLKNFDKVTRDSILCRYSQIEWKKVKGLRDIITHHYIDINAEAIFDICKNKIPALKEAIKVIMKDLEKSS